MARFATLDAEVPELARHVRRVFAPGETHVLATLRRDGSPRVSGIEVEVTDGELRFGSMPGAMKALDLRHDPRFALHSRPAEGGDARLSGRAVETAGPPEQGNHTFVLDLEQVTFVDVAPSRDHLVITTWRPGAPVAVVQRY